MCHVIDTSDRGPAHGLVSRPGVGLRRGAAGRPGVPPRPRPDGPAVLGAALGGGAEPLSRRSLVARGRGPPAPYPLGPVLRESRRRVGLPPTALAVTGECLVPEPPAPRRCSRRRAAGAGSPARSPPRSGAAEPDQL